MAFAALPASAGTVASTFDANCNVNYVNGGCGDRSVGSGANGNDSHIRERTNKHPECPEVEAKRG